MDQSHGDAGGFDPGHLDNEGWAGNFMDASLDAHPFPFELNGDVAGNVSFPSDQTLADHHNLNNPVAATESGSYAGQFIPAGQYIRPSPQFSQGTPATASFAPQQLGSGQLGSGYQPALQFDVGNLPGVQAGGNPNGMPQGFATGRGASFGPPQNAFGQVTPEAQSSWQGHAGRQTANGYHGHPSYTNLAPSQSQQTHHQGMSSQQTRLQSLPPQQSPPKATQSSSPQVPPQVNQQANWQVSQQPPQQVQLQTSGQVPPQTSQHVSSQINHQVPSQMVQQMPSQAHQLGRPQASQRAPSQPPQRVPQQLPQQVLSQGPPQVMQQASAQPSQLPQNVTPAAKQLTRPPETPQVNKIYTNHQQASRQVISTVHAPVRQLRVPDPYLKVDENLTKLNQAAGPSWVGAKHLMVEPEPEDRERIGRQQMVPVNLRSEKRRLFPQRSFPTPAECLGMHMDGCVSILRDPNSDPDAAKAKREQLDAILAQGLKRAHDREVPDKWKKRVDARLKEELKKYGQAQTGAILKDGIDTEIDEVRKAELEATAILHVAPGWQLDATSIAQITHEFCVFLKATLTTLRTTAGYKELPKAIRENSRKPTPQLQQEIQALREKVGPLRKAVERAVAVAADKGDSRILMRVGEKHNIIGPLFSTVINCINTEETNSPLVKVILRLFTHFSTITTPQLEEYKLFNARPKLQEQGDDETKSYLEKILAIAKENDGKVSSKPTKPPSEQPAASKTSSAAMTPKNGKIPAKPTPNSKAAPGLASSKRARDDDDDPKPPKKAATEAKASNPQGSAQGSSKRPRDDEDDLRASKKVATDSRASTAQAATKALPPKASSTSSQPGPSTANKPRPSIGLLPGKSRPPAKPAQKLEPPKTRTDLAKPPASSDSPPVSGPSKVEGGKPASEPAKAGKAKKSEAPRPDAQQPTTSRFAALMAEIAEPKKTKPTTPAPAKTPELDETPEEKKRRQKKEKRRRLNLRVSWKQGDELTEEFIFQKEESEDEGREGNMIRDAGDDQAEGKMLKQSRAGEIHPWDELLLVDFNMFPKERQEMNFVTRGGTKTFHTDQQKFMAERETKELMVIYTDPSDIPPTPKSPGPQPAEPAGPEGITHDPAMAQPWDKMRHRASDTNSFGPKESLRRLFQRFEEAKRGSLAEEMVERANDKIKKNPDPHLRLDPVWRDNEVAKLLHSDRVKQWREPEEYRTPKAQELDYNNPEFAQVMAILQAITDNLRNKPAPPQEPPEWQKDPERHAEWWRGYNQDKLRKEEQMKQEAARQAATQAQANLGNGYGNYGNPSTMSQPYGQQQQHHAYSQYYPGPQAAQPSAVPHPGTAPNDQVNALLAALAAQPQPAQPASATDATQALLASLNMAQGQQQLPQALPSGVPGIPNLQDPNQAQMLLAQLLAAQQPQGAQGSQAGSQAGSQTTHPYGAFPQGNNDNNALYAGATHGYGQEHQQQHRHQRDDARSGQGGRGRDKSGHGGRRGQSSGTGQRDNPDHRNNINQSLIGTKQCTFWLRGQCAKGDSCTFRHSYT